jgi:hypothetical protein
MEPQKHEMILRDSDPSGEEEWFCPTCGRRMTINWHPWRKTVLEQGDMYAAHSAIKGGLRLEVTDVNVGDASAQMDDPYLVPWQRWMEKYDSDRSGNDKTQ